MLRSFTRRYVAEDAYLLGHLIITDYIDGLVLKSRSFHSTAQELDFKHFAIRSLPHVEFPIQTNLRLRERLSHGASKIHVYESDMYLAVTLVLRYNHDN